MFTKNTTQNFTSSIESNQNQVTSSFPFSNKIQYGPIQVRRCRKTALRLETGRRSRYLVLFGDEAIKREKRREQNREAAKKLKEKRQLIEDELKQKLKDLEDEHSTLQNHLQYLTQKKENLQNEINNRIIDPIDELLSNDHHDIPSFFEQYSSEFDLFDDSLESIFNSDLVTSFNSVISD